MDVDLSLAPALLFATFQPHVNCLNIHHQSVLWLCANCLTQTNVTPAILSRNSVV